MVGGGGSLSMSMLGRVHAKESGRGRGNEEGRIDPLAVGPMRFRS